MKENFEMVAKTFQGLEDVLAEELRALGALNVEPGRRMVSFEGDLEMLYRANLCCRTALRVLKPIWRFTASSTDELYERAKEFDWGTVMSAGSTFSIDTVAYSDEFTHSQYVTYRVKDAIVDWFKDRYGADTRPGVRLQDADVMINVHIAGDRVTLSLDSSGESLHKRGYRVAQTDAPINEVLAAGIILKSGWRGDCPLVDPMCGSGTFLIEAAMIAANINPGVYRRHFSFENWQDFDHELFDRLYNDDSNEREVTCRILGADISPQAVEIARRNIKSAGVGKYIDLEVKPLSAWNDAPADGIMVTNPPYGKRISSDDMEGLYRLIGQKLKNIFQGYHAWIIAAKNEYIHSIGLSPSTKIDILNGSIECELREYIIFEGDYKHFRAEGHRLREIDDKKAERREERRREKNITRRFERRGEKPYDRPEKPSRGEKPFGRSNKSERGARYGREDKFSREDKFERPDRFDSGAERSERKTFAKRSERRGDRAGDPRNKLEERYSPRKPFAANADNPLARRRSEEALKSIMGKKPSLPPAEGPIMRERRGWKKQ